MGTLIDILFALLAPLPIAAPLALVVLISLLILTEGIEISFCMISLTLAYLIGGAIQVAIMKAVERIIDQSKER